jgi:Zn-dependent peptidase ImmA (M78 family)
MKVPWLPKASIAHMAENVILDYEKETGRNVSPPVPVEDIIEFGLGLRLAFEDLRGKLGMYDVLGATYVHSRKICADISLDRPGAEGRLGFTLAHESGHWVLHREWVDSAHRDGGFIFCRTRDSKKPIEWQADCFASCLLMPESLVREAFARACGPLPLVLHNVESAYSGPICFDPCVANWPAIADCIRRSGDFSNVSKQAMILRLQDLGLVRNETCTPLVWRKMVASS